MFRNLLAIAGVFGALIVGPADARRICPLLCGGSHGTPWTPLNLGISGTVWWNAQDLTKFTFNGSNVASWTDSYSGNVASQATSANQPAYMAAAVNGKSCLQFTATSTQSLAATTVAGALSIFSVFVLGNFPATSTQAFLGASATGGLEYRADTNGTYEALLQAFGSLGASTNASIANSNAFSYFSFNRPAGAFFVNGTAAGTFTNNVATGNTSTIIGSANGSELYNGVMCDILRVPAVLTTSQQQKLEGYEACTYGLQANLPGGHPYKSRCPLVSDP